MNLILDTRDISYSVYEQRAEKTILKNISFRLERNSALGISGESGSGKTTLAKIMAGILTPVSGTIKYFFSENHKKVSPVQILFQNTGEIINPLREVGKMLIQNSDIETLEQIIELVGISKQLLNKRGYELSGGEQQRVALARILSVKPELLILDEPFSAQDYESQENLLKLFSGLKKSINITMICITHNLRMLKRISDEVMIMYKGEIVEMNRTERLFSEPQNNYTKFLLKAEKYDLKYEEIKNFMQSSPDK